MFKLLPLCSLFGLKTSRNLHRDLCRDLYGIIRNLKNQVIILPVNWKDLQIVKVKPKNLLWVREQRGTHEMVIDYGV
jgi:hypothetical protein